MDERPKLPHYDADYCLKIAAWVVSICVGILTFELLLLLFVIPSDKCPGWAIYAENGSATSAWIFAGLFTGLPTIWICYVALRWKQKFSQQVYDSIAYRNTRPIFPNLGFGTKPKPDHQERDLEPNFEQIFFLDANALFLRIGIGWCLFCTFPLVLMVTKCTSVLQYFG
jgi:hypothetical protein